MDDLYLNLAIKYGFLNKDNRLNIIRYLESNIFQRFIPLIPF